MKKLLILVKQKTKTFLLLSFLSSAFFNFYRPPLPFESICTLMKVMLSILGLDMLP